MSRQSRKSLGHVANDAELLKDFPLYELANYIKARPTPPPAYIGEKLKKTRLQRLTHANTYKCKVQELKKNTYDANAESLERGPVWRGLMGDVVQVSLSSYLHNQLYRFSRDIKSLEAVCNAGPITAAIAQRHGEKWCIDRDVAAMLQEEFALSPDLGQKLLEDVYGEMIPWLSAFLEKHDGIHNPPIPVGDVQKFNDALDIIRGA